MELIAKLNWVVGRRLMKRLRSGRYEGTCSDGNRVRIDFVNDSWQLYFNTDFIGKYPLKRIALEKANALLNSERCDKNKIED